MSGPIITSGPQFSSFSLASEQEAPLLDVLGAEASDAWRHSPLSAIRRRLAVSDARAEQELDPRVETLPTKGGIRAKARTDPANIKLIPGTGEGEILSQETANEKVKEAGVKLKKGVPAYGITEGYLNILIEGAQKEQKLNEVWARADNSLGTGAARLITGLGVSIVDPINIASAFIPITGGGRLVQFGARVFNRAAPAPAAGLLPPRAGARAMQRAKSGAVEGAFGAALVEPIILSAAAAEQADYDMTDSLMNIAFGTVIGGGLHAGVGALRDRVALRKVSKELQAEVTALRDQMSRVEAEGSANRALDDASPEMRADLMRGTVSQMVDGRMVDVEIVGEFTPVRLVDRQEPNPAPLFETQDAEVLARISHPDEMSAYTALVKQRDTLRAQIDELVPERRSAADDATQEISSQIDELTNRLPDATKRNRKKLQARIDDLQKQLDAETAQLTATDTPEQARVRQELVAVDLQLRDAAPRITQIKNEARGRAEAEPFPVRDRPEFIVTPKWEANPRVDVIENAKASYAPESNRLADPKAAEEIDLYVEENQVREGGELEALEADVADLELQYASTLDTLGLAATDVADDELAIEARAARETVDDLEKYAPAALACFSRRG